MTAARIAALALAAALAGCASHPAPVIVAEAPPPPPLPVEPAPPPPAPAPAGAAENLAIPVALPDGSYPTPNRDIAPAVAVWHLRAALNVAALGCRGPEEAALIAGYNRLLGARKGTFEAARKAALAAAGSQAVHDTAMTKLYNYWSQPPAHDAFCARAGAALAAAEAVPAKDKLGPTALVELAELDRPFTDFYAAYDSWRRDRAAATASTTATGSAAVPAEPVVTAAAGTPPQLRIDLRTVAVP